MSPRLWLLPVLSTVMLLAGCRTEASRLSLAPPSRPATAWGERFASKADGDATVLLKAHWQPLEDQRLDPHAVGGIGRPRVAEDIKGWVERALHDITVPGLQFIGDPAEADLVLHPRLVKAYVQGVDVTKSAVVVFTIHYDETGYEPFTRLYRGVQASMNWWNSDAELGACLQTALSDALHSVEADLSGRVQRAARSQSPEGK